MAALAARRQPADQRHEVARRQPRAAPLAIGTPPDDRAALRQAADHHTEKAADERCQHEQGPALAAEPRPKTQGAIELCLKHCRTVPPRPPESTPESTP